jgi:hypothetical protein
MKMLQLLRLVPCCSDDVLISLITNQPPIVTWTAVPLVLTIRNDVLVIREKPRVELMIQGDKHGHGHENQTMSDTGHDQNVTGVA